jgi:acetyl-CoA carboxylase biotin carboxyl carrier protein
MTAPRDALLRDGDRTILASPAVGYFRAAVAVGDVVHGGSRLGALEILGQLVPITAPAAARGVVTAIADAQLARAPVGYGELLVELDPAGAIGVAAAAAGPAHHIAGLVFKAPTSGRFYGRSAPDKPPFVAVGAELAPGATICLLEVMKTFHRVTYGGPGLPERARVRELLVAEGADVSAGDALLALDPST